MIYPSRRAISLFALSLPFALFGIILGGATWVAGLIWVFICLLLFIYDFRKGLDFHKLEARLSQPPLLYIGDVEPLRLTLLTTAQQRVEVDAHLDVNSCLEPLGAAHIGVYGGQADAIFELRPRWRGVGKISRIWLRWDGPLGLIYRRKILQPDVSIPIVPNVRAVRAAAIAFYARDARLGQKEQKDKGDSQEFKALKEYTRGLDSRTIDWKHSARHSKLLVKEYEAERNHNIVLCVDTGHLMREPLDGLSRLDRAINAALITAYVSLRQGDRVGLFGFDDKIRQAIRPLNGETAFQAIQAGCSKLDYSGSETNFTLGLSRLSSQLHRRSLIIMMTEFVDTTTAELMLASVHRLTKRHLVLFTTFKDESVERLVKRDPSDFTGVTRAVVAEDFRKERALVFARLRHMGVEVLDCSPDQFSTELVNRYLQIKERGVI